MKQLIPGRLTYCEVGHLPVVKQFLISMRCVDRNIPILGAAKDGNASDKTLNNELLSGISKHMARHGLEPAASYRLHETLVDLYGHDYRAIGVHSSAHDKRRHKRIDRLVAQKRKALDAECKTIRAATYFCRADAQAAADKLKTAAAGSYHNIEVTIEKVAKYSRGRPAKDTPRTPTGHEYPLRLKITPDDEKLAPLRIRAGCFVLITNLTRATDRQTFLPGDLLRLYKSQDGIERNFSFLKDPVIVNSIFLKKNHRIEVLGLVLLISLLIWRLIEHCMRAYISRTGHHITGWKDKPTSRPTTFMLTTKFMSIIVLRLDQHRQLARPLNPVQLEYLKALDLDPAIFTSP